MFKSTVLQTVSFSKILLLKYSRVIKTTEYIHGEHTVHDIKYHLVWITKYRYKILLGKIAKRAKELLIDHIHMLISAPTNLAPSKIAQYLKGRSSKLLQEEFPDLGKRY